MKTSCVIAMYNGQSYIEEQLMSILQQTVSLDEIIIVDDNSKDNSFEIVHNFKNEFKNVNIILEKNEVNLGVNKTFEKGIKLTIGEVIFLSDQDDIWMNNKVEVFLEYANKFPKKNLLYSDGLIVDSELNEISSLSSHYNWKQNTNSNRGLLMAIELQNFIPGCSMALRKDYAFRYLPIPYRIINIYDGWFANLSHLELSSICIPEKLIKYRQHNLNQIGTKKKSFISRLVKQFKFDLWIDYVSLMANQYFELKDINEIDQKVKNSLTIRYNYYNSAVDCIKKKKITKSHFHFTREILKSHIINCNYILVLRILKLDAILLAGLKLNLYLGGNR